MMQGMITMLKMLGIDPDKIQADMQAGLDAIQNFHSKLDAVIGALQAVDVRLVEVENFMRDHVSVPGAQFVPASDTVGVLPPPSSPEVLPEPVGLEHAATPEQAQADTAPSSVEPAPVGDTSAPA